MDQVWEELGGHLAHSKRVGGVEWKFLPALLARWKLRKKEPVLIFPEEKAPWHLGICNGGGGE